MKQITLATSITLLLSSAAFADSPWKGDVMPQHNWTGFYAGFNAGIVNHTLNMTDVEATTFLATIEQVSNPQFTGGLQAGYRRQVDLSSVSGVYGLEVSGNYSEASFSREYGSSFATYRLDSSNKLNFVLLAELMGGIAANKTLLFVTAGLSWANISGSTKNTSGVPFFDTFSVKKNAFGTALGAGIEYACNEKISIRLKVDVITPNTYTTYNDTGDSFLISNSIVQSTLGVNFKIA